MDPLINGGKVDLMVELVLLFEEDDGNLFLVIVASMLGCFH